MSLAGTCSFNVSAADERSWSVDFSGQIRERVDSTSNPGFGFVQRGSDDYLLHRLIVGAEAGIGRHFKMSGEIVSGSVTGARSQMPATHDDPLDVLQLFAETGFDAGRGEIRVRSGRQSIGLGASRLVSSREGTNVRRAFDGVRATWSRTHSRLDAFYLSTVLPRTGVFDDTSEAAPSLWGLYFTRNAAQSDSSGVDLYYLGYRNRDAEFAFETAPELRHTTGGRVFGENGGRDWNLEAAWQWGSFGNSSIRAWAFSADIGYTLPGSTRAPRLGFKADAISGDRDPSDATLETFNALFPRLPYFTDANVATPANLFDLQPTVSVNLAEDVHVSGGWNVLWKLSRQDALYLPPLQPVSSTSNSSRRYIGQQWAATLVWKPATRVAVTGSFVYFEPGEAIRNAGGTSGSFFAAWVQIDL